jgi:uncharacterized protein (DUF2062 family)
MKEWFQRRIVAPILALLKQGITPDKLALSLAFGIGFGLFPVLGASTILCAAAALALRLNMPAIQLVNYALSPLQLLLIIPFVRVGEAVTGAAAFPITISGGFAILAQGALHAIKVLWDAIVHAALGWVIVAPLCMFALYRLFRPMLERAQLRIKTTP